MGLLHLQHNAQTDAPLECPLKKSVIAWGRCEQYRAEYGCLCKEARDRLRLKGEGREVYEQKLAAIRQAVPDRPPGWTVERASRFYMIHDANGELVHRATNQDECDDYLRLRALVDVLRHENEALWELLREELVEDEDPWAEVERRLGRK